MVLRVFFRHLLGHFAGWLALVSLLLVLEGLLGGISLMSLVAVIDVFMHPDLAGVSGVTRRAVEWMQTIGMTASLAAVLGLFLALQITQNGIGIGARSIILATRQAVLRKLVLGTFDTLLAARWEFFTRTKQGLILNTLGREVNAAADAFKGFAFLLATAVQLACYVSVPLFLSWKLTAVAVGTGAVLALPLLALSPLNYRLGRATTASSTRFSVVVQESITLIKVVFGFGNQASRRRELGTAFEEYSRAVLRSLTLRAALPLIYEPVGVLVLVTTLLAAQRLSIPVSEFAALAWALHKSVGLIGELVSRWNTLVNLVPSYQQVLELAAQAEEAAERPGPRAFSGLTREIRIERGTFAYPGQPPTLVDVSIRVPKGCAVAIVGDSGAGKSTLLDVLMGFHTLQAGTALVDDTPLSQLDLTSYRQRIGYVGQETVLFNATIRENLRWAKPDATDAEIREVCVRTNVDEFVQRFTEGYDTMVGDRGVRLSGGQAQRVALARAMLRQPDILILDEATSSLDSQSERLIQQAVDGFAKETTVLIVTHRLSTVTNVDHIYVLRDGRIVEEGPYQRLMSGRGTFSAMAQLQALETVP
jgi:ABC-type multidrug transport system fused ATPase/permease subunit